MIEENTRYTYLSIEYNAQHYRIGNVNKSDFKIYGTTRCKNHVSRSNTLAERRFNIHLTVRLFSLFLFTHGETRENRNSRTVFIYSANKP